jgi:ABC-2 type transport system permease protein
MRRALREAVRQPAVEISNIFLPVFFFIVTVGAQGAVAGRAFGVDNYVGFQLPVAVLLVVGGGNGSSALGTVRDIESGYFDKLSLTPAHEMALALGRFGADGVRVMFLSLPVLAIGLAAGSGLHAGVPGAVMLIVLAGTFSICSAGIGTTVALLTRSSQGAAAGFLIFFPLLFFAPAFAPRSVFTGWLSFIAMINPVTYVMEGMRGLVLTGWDAQGLAQAFGSALGLGAFTFGTTWLALQRRHA